MKNFYEFSYIVSAVLEDEQYKAVVEKVNAMLTENGATIDEVDEWGMRRLQYPIKKQHNGYYVNMYFEVEGSVIVKLERQLEINDSILRYMTLKYDAKMRRHLELRRKGNLPLIFEPAPETDEEKENKDSKK
jgi:small subunit ribosomal protein S6